MAHLWVQHGDDWEIAALAEDRYELAQGSVPPVRAYRNVEGASEVLLCRTSAAADAWALVCPPGACRVNGEPVALGLRALSDRDEIRVPGGPRLYFSTERLAAVQPFAGAAEPVVCPRCRQDIAAGCPSVACPVCGVRYHEDADSGLTCWTYAPDCAVCGSSTSVDTSFRWSPAAL